MFKKLFNFLTPRANAGHVYYARLKTPQGLFYKIGFTRMPSVAARFGYSGQGDEKLIERVLLFAYHRNARKIEQTLLEHFDPQRAFGRYSNNPNKPLAGRGQSELFFEDVLGLDKALYQASHEHGQTLKKQRGSVMAGFLLILIGLALAPFTYGLTLILVIGGLISVTRKRHTVKPQRRPKHPKHIQKIIDSLTKA